MKREVRIDHVEIRFPDAAPPISVWLCTEIEHWISRKRGQEVKAEIIERKGECSGSSELDIDRTGGADR